MISTLLRDAEVTNKLLEAILDSPGGRRSLSRFARTCRAISEPALDLLWKELDSIAPIIGLFPASLLKKARRPGLGLVSCYDCAFNAFGPNSYNFRPVSLAMRTGPQSSSTPLAFAASFTMKARTTSHRPSFPCWRNVDPRPTFFLNSRSSLGRSIPLLPCSTALCSCAPTCSTSTSK